MPLEFNPHPDENKIKIKVSIRSKLQKLKLVESFTFAKCFSLLMGYHHYNSPKKYTFVLLSSILHMRRLDELFNLLKL